MAVARYEHTGESSSTTWFGAGLLAIVGYIVGQFMDDVVLEWVTYIITVGLAFAGTTRVPVGFYGVYTFFGQRVKFVVREGWAWALPAPIMNIILVDGRERPINLKMREVPSQDNVQVIVDVSLQVRTSDPYHYLAVVDLEGDKAEDGISSGGTIPELTDSVVRGFASRHPVADDPTKHGEPGESRALIKQKAKMEIRLRRELEEHAANEHWGISFLRVIVPAIHLPDDLAKDFQRLRQEPVQRATESAEVDTVVDLSNRLKEKVGLTPQQAVDSVQAIQGKIRKERLDVGGNADSLTKAATIVRK